MELCKYPITDGLVEYNSSLMDDYANFKINVVL